MLKLVAGVALVISCSVVGATDLLNPGGVTCNEWVSEKQHPDPHAGRYSAQVDAWIHGFAVAAIKIGAYEGVEKATNTKPSDFYQRVAAECLRTPNATISSAAGAAYLRLTLKTTEDK